MWLERDRERERERESERESERERETVSERVRGEKESSPHILKWAITPTVIISGHKTPR